MVGLPVARPYSTSGGRHNLARDEKADHVAAAGGRAQGVGGSVAVGRMRDARVPGGGTVRAGGGLDIGPLNLPARVYLM